MKTNKVKKIIEKIKERKKKGKEDESKEKMK